MKSFIHLLLAVGVVSQAWAGAQQTLVRDVGPQGSPGFATPAFNASPLQFNVSEQFTPDLLQPRHRLWSVVNPLSLNTTFSSANPVEPSNLWLFGTGFEGFTSSLWVADDLYADRTEELRARDDSQAIVVPLPGAVMLALLGLGSGALLRRSR